MVTYAGERFDFVVETNRKVDNYWMRFRGLIDCGPEFDKIHQLAVLRYEGAPNEDPSGPIGYDEPKNIDMTMASKITLFKIPGFPIKPGCLNFLYLV